MIFGEQELNINLPNGDINDTNSLLITNCGILVKSQDYKYSRKLIACGIVPIILKDYNENIKRVLDYCKLEYIWLNNIEEELDKSKIIKYRNDTIKFIQNILE